jgi:hypothetical protein
MSGLKLGRICFDFVLERLEISHSWHIFPRLWHVVIHLWYILVAFAESSPFF